MASNFNRNRGPPLAYSRNSNSSSSPSIEYEYETTFYPDDYSTNSGNYGMPRASSRTYVVSPLDWNQSAINLESTFNPEGNIPTTSGQHRGPHVYRQNSLLYSRSEWLRPSNGTPRASSRTSCSTVVFSSDFEMPVDSNFEPQETFIDEDYFPGTSRASSRTSVVSQFDRNQSAINLESTFNPEGNIPTTSGQHRGQHVYRHNSPLYSRSEWLRPSNGMSRASSRTSVVSQFDRGQSAINSESMFNPEGNIPTTSGQHRGPHVYRHNSPLCSRPEWLRPSNETAVRNSNFSSSNTEDTVVLYSRIPNFSPSPSIEYEYETTFYPDDYSTNSGNYGTSRASSRTSVVSQFDRNQSAINSESMFNPEGNLPTTSGQHRPEWLRPSNDIEDETGIANEVRVVLIGKTGSGKSASGNTFLGTNVFKSKAGGRSITQKCSCKTSERFGKILMVVDTPGLFDTGMTYEKVITEIVKCIGISSPGPHAFVFVIPIGRFTEEERKTVEGFVDIFGETMYRHMIVLFTRGEEIEREKIDLETYIAKRTPIELRALVRKCSDQALAISNVQEHDKRERDAKLFIRLVDEITRRNGGCYYSNEMYTKAEEQLKRRVNEVKRQKEREMENEKRQIKEQLFLKYQYEFESLHDQMEEAERKVRGHERKVKELQEKISMAGKFQRQQMQNKIERLINGRNEMKRRVREVERRQNEMERKRKLEERKRIEDLELKYKEIKAKMRGNERSKIEKGDKGSLEMIYNGIKMAGGGIWKGVKGIYNLLSR